jgi:light-regulated signal transduction histidine kinase (bacteriophytochrome)
MPDAKVLRREIEGVLEPDRAATDASLREEREQADAAIEADTDQKLEHTRAAIDRESTAEDIRPSGAPPNQLPEVADTLTAASDTLACGRRSRASRAPTERHPGGTITVSVERHERGCRISVSDTGKGIPPEEVGRIFDRFHQTSGGDRHGLGLGLYISKAIVDAHGGRIWVSSEPGRGSTFLFTLPA